MAEPDLVFYRDLYGPDWDPPYGGGKPQKGDDVLAVKRTLARAGFMEWLGDDFSDEYGEKSEEGCKAFQKSVGIGNPPKGHYGQSTHEALLQAEREGHPGESAWDDYSVELYANAVADPPLTFAFKRDLYGPDWKPPFGGGNPQKGDDVLAVRRAIARAGFMNWDTAVSSNEYGDKIENAVKKFQESVGIKGQDGSPPKGHYGSSTHSALLKAKRQGQHHEWAFDDYSVKLYKDYEPKSSSGGRDATMKHLEKRLGYTEQPANSNCDNRSDGIRTSQDHTAGGGTWLRNQPWCGCWCYYGLEAGGVQGLNSNLASVASIEEDAKAKRGCFKGWTTDRSKVKKGDLVVIGGYGVHVETVRGFSGSNTLTYGGNTSPGSSGSQSNGGGAYERSRYPSEVRGYALVRFPGE